MPRQATYIRTNAPTVKVKTKRTTNVNKTALMVLIAYKKHRQWLRIEDFIVEAAKDGIALKTHQVSHTLRELSGVTPGILPSHQRDELVRRSTGVTTMGGGFIYEYKFNPAGTVRTKGPTSHGASSNMTTARFVGRVPPSTRIS